jgi:cytochrome c-type biogenesis protein CcmH/NrfG
MAHVKLVCSECGAELSVVDAICPGCGAAIERKQAKSRADRLKSPPTVPVSEPRKREGTPKRFEPWQVVAGLAVIALVAFFVYTELQRDHASDQPVAQQQAPPAMMQQAPPAMMQQAPRVNLAPLEQAVAANPKDADALLRLGNGLHDNGAYARAIEVYGRYLAIQPDDPDARVDMGVCYYELGKVDTAGGARLLETARTEMELALRKHPDHQPAAFNLGIAREEDSGTAFSHAVASDQQGGRHMPSGKKRKRHKMATHKRKKRLRKMRHKKKIR